jgi:hypothetical protein
MKTTKLPEDNRNELKYRKGEKLCVDYRMHDQRDVIIIKQNSRYSYYRYQNV